MRRSVTWLYFITTLLLIAAASLVTFVFPGAIVRPYFIMAFLFICPGMAVVGFFGLRQVVIEWPLILVFSIAVDAFIAGIVLYSGLWSPVRILLILIAFCLLGMIAQLILAYIHSDRSSDVATIETVKMPAASNDVAAIETVKTPAASSDVAAIETVKTPASSSDVAAIETIKMPTRSEHYIS